MTCRATSLAAFMLATRHSSNGFLCIAPGRSSATIAVPLWWTWRFLKKPVFRFFWFVCWCWGACRPLLLEPVLLWCPFHLYYTTCVTWNVFSLSVSVLISWICRASHMNFNLFKKMVFKGQNWFPGRRRISKRRLEVLPNVLWREKRLCSLYSNCDGNEADGWSLRAKNSKLPSTQSTGELSLSIGRG